MKAINYYYLEEEGQWLGYLQDYPDYEKEAESFESLHSNLSHLNFDFTRHKDLKHDTVA